MKKSKYIPEQCSQCRGFETFLQRSYPVSGGGYQHSWKCKKCNHTWSSIREPCLA